MRPCMPFPRILHQKTECSTVPAVSCMCAERNLGLKLEIMQTCRSHGCMVYDVVFANAFSLHYKCR
jgi:hypothetical protein